MNLGKHILRFAQDDNLGGGRLDSGSKRLTMQFPGAAWRQPVYIALCFRRAAEVHFNQFVLQETC